MKRGKKILFKRREKEKTKSFFLRVLVLLWVLSLLVPSGHVSLDVEILLPVVNVLVPMSLLKCFSYRVC